MATHDRQFYIDRAQARRDNRDERIAQLISGVEHALRKFRAEHGWQPGWIWKPETDAYAAPVPVTALVTAPMSGASDIDRAHACALCKKDHPPCVFTAGSLSCQTVKCRNPHHAGKRRSR